MTAEQWAAITPLIATGAGAPAVMLAVAVRRCHAAAMCVTLAALGGSLVTAIVLAAPLGAQDVGHMFRLDAYAAVYLALIAGSAAMVAAAAWRPMALRSAQPEEFYILLLLAALGAQALVCSVHFASLLLGLELLSVPLYAMIAYRRREAAALEAGVKYLILGGASSALLVLGMALVYAEAGTLRLGELAAAAAATGALGLAGWGLVLTGIGFKLSLVPLQMWTPDVFEGSPAAVGGFLSTVSKGAMFALLVRYYLAMDVARHPAPWTLLYAVAIATMSAGNLLALRQRDVKRLLGGSSIAHMGYLLVPLLAGGATAAEAVTFYLVAYCATTLAAFGVVAAAADAAGEEMGDIAACRGLAWRRPGLAAVLTVAMLSLAGMPLTAGFLAKYYAVLAGVGASMWALVLVLLGNSVVGLFYYLRVVQALYALPEETAPPGSPLPRAEGTTALLPALALAALTAGVVWLGVQPGPLARAVQAAVRSLF